MAIGTKVRFRIHPAVGIARLGNSPAVDFVGPEVPGIASVPPDGFKDSVGRIKRQAVCFRVYEYNEMGPVRELTSSEAELTWTVHLRNRKAEWHKFAGESTHSQPRRNPKVTGSDRARLVVDPGPRPISGRAAAPVRLTGTFGPLPLDGGTMSDAVEVTIGELRTDERGQLLVLGGFGCSGSVKLENPVTHYANNDYWYDDTSDGPVDVRIRLNGATDPVPESEIEGAWVIVAPPDFAPSITNIVTLWDVLEQVAMDQGWRMRPSDVEFSRDIYPMLERAAGYAWVNRNGLRGHGAGGRQDFLDPTKIKILANPNRDPDSQPWRERHAVFARIRKPQSLRTPDEVEQQATPSFMPPLSGDDGDAKIGKPRQWLTVTHEQYARLGAWANGDFSIDERVSSTKTLDDLPVAERPRALDRAALEACVGGAFYPGIEMTFIARKPDTWKFTVGADGFVLGFRINRDRFHAGAVTAYMALPWQADFYACREHWWPAQRPDDVIPEQLYKQQVSAEALAKRLTHRVRWDRGLGTNSDQRRDGDNDMIRLWSQLGFVVRKPSGDARGVYVETERDPYAGLDQRMFYHLLLNIEAHPEFRRRARTLVDEFLADAWKQQSHDKFPEYWKYFNYSEAEFELRLDWIYRQYIDGAAGYNPAVDPRFKTREQLVDRLRQMAPFNQLDGVWLRNIGKRDDPVSLIIFEVWNDERGGGRPERSHANIYTDLLHSLHIYLPDPAAVEYANHAGFLDSAFTNPVFQLSISEFPDECLPEILGMTLQLEWEVVSLKPAVERMRYFGIDPYFYELHMGIDNAADGHGALAKRAVQMYLDRFTGQAQQREWKRIWNGYIAFAVTGEVAQQQLLPTAERQRLRMVQMIERKRRWAQLSHGTKQLGSTRINDWLDQPEHFLDELVEAGLAVPGDLASPILDRMSVGGPMHKVFTEEEVQLWRDWIVSLGQVTPPPSNLVDLMQRVIKTLRHRQAGALGHRARLEGPDPTNSMNTVTQDIHWWFDQTPLALMGALANPKNGWVVPGDSKNSALVRYLLGGDGGMARALRAVVPGTNGMETYASVLVQWIQNGCPLQASRVATQLDAAPPVLHERVWGMGAVH